MRILVTGGTGYIGSHTVKGLLRVGYEVTVLDNLSRGHREVAEILPGARYVWGDIADRSLVCEILSSRRIGAVMHFAASSLVGESVIDPAVYYQNNVAGGLALLDSVHKTGVPYFVFSSTAAVYGEPDEIPIREEHPQCPTNPYGSTKKALEDALRWYSQAYGMKYVALRYFNAAGADPDGQLGEDHKPESHLIPLVIQAAMGKRADITVFGTDYDTPDGTCLRDYVHVTDLADAHVRAINALTNGLPSSVYNLGNEEGNSVRQVIDVVRQVSQRDFKVIEGQRRPGDPGVLVASSQRIKQELGWNPQYGDIESIVKTAWEWHKNHPRGYGR